MRTRFEVLLLTGAFIHVAALAADPPSTMNYQAVLRDAAGGPRTGTFDMVFRFFDAPASGNEILGDPHTAGWGNAVAVTNGLFNVHLGEGAVFDGSGPGTYTSLGGMFRDHADVWMELTIGGETLSPRVKIQASAYALNSGSLQGKPSSSFLQTSSIAQAKSGPLSVTSASDAVTGINFYSGATGALGGFFYDIFIEAGVVGYGGAIGGGFTNTAGSHATIANYAEGVQAAGQSTGGVFANSTGSGVAVLAAGNTGLAAYGTYPERAGRFKNLSLSGSTDFATADLAIGDTGIAASGTFVGGEFAATPGGYVAVLADDAGDSAGWFFAPLVAFDPWTEIASSAHFGFQYGLVSNAPKAFAQNHPTDPSRLIAYLALEGPEAGTYTRGSGSIRRGEARIALDPTFALTTNPDIGLTAVVTPRRPRADLYVASVSTKELVVRSGSGSADEVAFDYVVNGLRIGFENQPAILPSAAFPNATVPSLEVSAASLAARSEDVQDSTPLARISAERARSGADAPELAGARALIAGINSSGHALRTRSTRAQQGPVVQPKGAPPSPVETASPAGSRTSSAGSAAAGSSPGRTGDAVTPSTGGATGASAGTPSGFSMPVEVEVQPGDVLSHDPSMPGSLRLAEKAGDPAVVGVVAGPAGSRFRGQAPIAPAGTIVPCKVDASQRPIAVGDLLVASAVPGMAMCAGADPRKGAVIGKALEPLSAGTGTIRMLVMSR